METTSDDDYDDYIIENVLKDYIVEKCQEYFKPTKKKRVIRYCRNIDYSKTKWGLLISDPNTRVASTHKGKLFRRRFRVPFPLFEEVLLEICHEHKIFGHGRNSRIPISIKLMTGLRILGRGSCSDDLSELVDTV